MYERMNASAGLFWSPLCRPKLLWSVVLPKPCMPPATSSAFVSLFRYIPWETSAIRSICASSRIAPRVCG